MISVNRSVRLAFCLALIPVWAFSQPHTADYRPPAGVIDLTELLRVIQFFNSSGLQCAAGSTEDGYFPGTGTLRDCLPHNSDYAPQNWNISLQELLRLIQFFNVGAYHREQAAEDGFTPGPGSLKEDVEGTEESDQDGMTEGQLEAESSEGPGEGIAEAETAQDGFDEEECLPEGISEGEREGAIEYEGAAEEIDLEREGLAPEGLFFEASQEGLAQREGIAEGMLEGAGTPEGMPEGVTEGIREGEGMPEGNVEAEDIPIIHEIGWRTTAFVDTSRGNRSISVRIYYPADTAGENVPVTSAGEQSFPVIVFAHGFQISIDSYNYLWQMLTPRGYFFILVNSETGFLPSHSEFGKDLAFCVTQFQEEGANLESPFYNRVASASAVMGHSMGGGAALLAVQHNPAITTLVALAAAETNPSAITAAGSITIPALLLAGADDCVTPPESNQIPMYTAMPSPCKILASIAGGSHCQFAQNAALCDIAQGLACFRRTYVTDTIQRGLVLKLLEPWLESKLKARKEAWPSLISALNTAAADGTILYTADCSAVE